jgi:hypothetical protein
VHQGTRRLAIAGALAVALSAATAGPASSASAAPAPAGANGLGAVGPAGTVSAQCMTAVDIGYTIKSGSYIRGSASYTKCNNELYSVLIVLNRVQGPLGVPVVRRLFLPAPYGSHSYGVAYNCAGRGTYTYYTQIVTYANTGQVTAHKTSNKLRVNC